MSGALTHLDLESLRVKTRPSPDKKKPINLPTLFAESAEKGWDVANAPQTINYVLDTNKRSVKSHGYITESLMLTGKSKQGSDIVIFSHLPTEFTDPENLERLIGEDTPFVSEDLFYQVLGLEDNENVYVVDKKIVDATPNGWFSKDTRNQLSYNKGLASEHPFLKQMVGGEEIFNKWQEKENSGFTLIMPKYETDKPIASMIHLTFNNPIIQTFYRLGLARAINYKEKPLNINPTE